MNETLWGFAHIFAYLFEAFVIVAMVVLGAKAIRGAIRHFRPPRRAEAAPTRLRRAHAT